MANNLRNVAFLRNGAPYDNLAAAKQALIDNIGLTLDGSPIIGRYLYGSGETKSIKSVIGIAHKGINGYSDDVTFFESANDIADTIAKLQAELNATQTAVGTNADGTHATSSSHFTSAATTVEAEIAALAKALEELNFSGETNENQVFSKITETEGKVSTEVKNLTDVKIGGYTVGADNSGKVAETDTLGAALGKLQGQINGMDKDGSAVAGQVVTTVTEADGKVGETKSNVNDLQLGGYVKDDTATGAVASADTINTALSKIENTIGANKIGNVDGSINVTPNANGTDINVNIKSGEKVIKLDADGGGLYTNLNVVKITSGLDAAIKESYELHDSDGNKIGESINIPKDSHIVSISYLTEGEHAQNLEYKYIDAKGAEQTTYVDMGSLVLETEVENGIQAIDHKLSIKLDTTGDDTGDGKFLTVGANGLKLNGVTAAISGAIGTLDVTDDEAVAGQYVAAIQEADGIVSVKTRANVSDAVLNGYSKGEKPASTAIAATDDVKGAIAKLEHQIDDAKAAATTEVVEGSDSGNNLSITSSASTSDGHTIYTINLTDVASASGLTAEIARAKAAEAAFDGILGSGKSSDSETRTWTKTNTNYIGSGVTVKNDLTILDSKLYELSGKSVTEITTSAANGLSATSAKTDNNTVKYDLKVVLDETNENGNNTYVSDSGSNVLQLTNNGLYLSNIWDCGTF